MKGIGALSLSGVDEAPFVKTANLFHGKEE